MRRANNTREDGQKYSTSTLECDGVSHLQAVIPSWDRKQESVGARGKGGGVREVTMAKTQKEKQRKKRGYSDKRVGAQRDGRIWHAVPCAQLQ